MPELPLVEAADNQFVAEEIQWAVNIHLLDIPLPVAVVVEHSHQQDSPRNRLVVVADKQLVARAVEQVDPKYHQIINSGSHSRDDSFVVLPPLYSI